ncbi:hypothetical protein HMPREF9419_0214 [Prevotella nigrescens ATCC 33563]|nr:hypothetical protein HMPREF9419_0214 [Prevotella nigrescens ATCC 33563]
MSEYRGPVVYFAAISLYFEILFIILPSEDSLLLEEPKDF